MSGRLRLAAISFALCGSCALLPREPSTEPDSQADLDSFVESVRQDFEAHEWQNLLSASDPALYENVVVAGEVEEVRYLADLFGLTEPGNTIQEGDTLEWADLDRVTTVALAPVAGDELPHRATGFITLESMEELDLETWVTQVQGRYVLTAAP